MVRETRQVEFTTTAARMAGDRLTRLLRNRSGLFRIVTGSQFKQMLLACGQNTRPTE
jgi:hypothetical protein